MKPRNRKLPSLAARWAAKGALLWSSLACDAGTSPPAATPPAKSTVHLRGHAYSFSTPDALVGAEIRVVELPGLVTKTGKDGGYELAIDVTAGGQEVTPYIVAADYHTIHLQTFVLAKGDKNLELVNFQTPSEVIYGVLSQVVGVDPKGTGCHVVTTISEIAIQSKTFLEFTKHGPHGIADITAQTSPPLPPPIYFNESVIPDAKLTKSSRDGGVLWTNVPPGRYQVSASHPARKFDTFIAVCAPGRIVNANPPWGLREL